MKPELVQSGDLMAFTYWGVVKDSYRNAERLSVEDVQTGTSFEVHGRPLIEESFSADRFEEEKKVTKTKLAEVLVGLFNIPFTVTFEKAGGDKRVLRGRMVSPEPLLGRSTVEDLDIPRGENRLRLVDHRTILSIVSGGVKYILK